jgi:hypothetical protein
MSVSEVRFWWAAVCGIAAYVLPLTLWGKRKAVFPVELLAIPALVIGAWWFADAMDLRPGRVGFTFYGALPAAVLSNLLVLLLLKIRTLEPRRMLRGILIVVGCVLAGIAVQLLLPPVPE